MKKKNVLDFSGSHEDEIFEVLNAIIHARSFFAKKGYNLHVKKVRMPVNKVRVNQKARG